MVFPWVLNFRAQITTSQRLHTELCRATSPEWNFSSPVSTISRKYVKRTLFFPLLYHHMSETNQKSNISCLTNYRFLHSSVFYPTSTLKTFPYFAITNACLTEASSTRIRIFSKTEIFSPYLEKSASTQTVLKSYLHVHTYTQKRF